MMLKKPNLLKKAQTPGSVALAIAFLATLAACTKDRIPSFPDGQGQNIYEKALFDSAEMKISTGSVGDVSEKSDPSYVPVQSVEGPETLRPMFSKLDISAKPNETYTVRFKVTRDNVTAYRVVMGDAELSTLDMALRIKSDIGESLVPMFIYPITNYGMLVRAKNELGEETANLRLQETEWNQASHVEVAILSKNRQEFRLKDQSMKPYLFSIADLKSASVVATVDNTSSFLGGGADKNGKSAAAVQAPEGLRALFAELSIKGQPGKSYPLKLELNKKRLTAYKQVSDINELDSIERSLMVPRKSTGSPILVPVFTFDIQASGKLVRVRDEKNVETTAIDLQASEFSQATHVIIAALSKFRQEVRGQTDEMEQIFSKDSVDSRLFTRAELHDKLGLGIEVKGDNASSVYLSKLDRDKLNLFLITTGAQLSDVQRKKLAAGDPEVKACSAEVLSQLKAMTRSTDDCVMVLRYKGNIEQGNLALGEDEDGLATSQIVFKSGVKDVKDASQIRITKGTVLAETNPGSDHDFDASRTLKVAEMGGEYLFRRTMEDSPNGFDYTFPGESGPLEIVKFVFEEKGVRIVRADALTPSTGANENDKETLMFIPAAYFRVEKTDVAGNPLTTPNYVPTRWDDKSPNVIAYVDWTANKIPNVSSPMNYYSLETCFLPSDVKTISNVDHRLATDAGVLNFTVSTTYSANPSMDCAGIYQMSYFDAVQTSFTFNERISFKRYAKGDETPMLNLPFGAQKLLGMGLFTYNKKAPNKNGNVGTDGTEVALPSVWDIRNGKTVDYVLAGLPENPEIRKAVIKATREVVADWNAAFVKAFAGTPMARGSDVVTLKVQGEDLAADKVGELGDLDKNFLYYVDKRTESSIIGLGGNHANPRSGRVEAGSVFIYGGNILSYVESLRKMYKARAEYHKIMDQVIPLPAKPGSGNGNGKASSKIGGKLSELLAKIDPKMANQMVQIADVAGAPARLKSGGEALAQATGQSLTEDAASRLRKSLRADQLAVFEAINQSVASGAIRDPQALELAILENQIRYMGKSLSNDQMAVLRSTYARRKAVNELFTRLTKANICVRDSAQALGTLGVANGFDITKMSDIDVMVAVYKPTLAHEMGHNLGLRHNFIGSFDQANWYFENEKKQGKDAEGKPITVGTSKRDYSSIMDYLSDDHETYDGIGPQDVAAIRTAYTGLIELAPQSVPVAQAKGKLVGDRFIDANEYRKLLGLSSWLNFSADSIAKLPIRKYLFCTDEDVLFAPVCNRFDKGVTPGEIVRNIGEDYRTMYALRNFPNDKLHFDGYDTGSYIGRIFGMLTPARQFMEETIYQAITLPDSPARGEIINAYADGAVEAMFLLNEIARTPDAPASVKGTDRFVGYETDKGIVAIEQKWLEDMSTGDSVDSRLAVRGIEYDKVIATILLTQRSMGFPRYERRSLRLSFPEFENMVGVKLDKEAPDGSVTLNLLKSMLMDNVTPMAPTATGFAFLTTGENKSSVNELLRAYATLGAIVNLDVDGLEVKDNLSSLFRVSSGYTAPRGVVSVAPTGITGTNARGELKLWAFDQNYSAKNMIGFVNVADQVLSVKDSLTKDLQQWFATAAPSPQDGPVDEVPSDKPATGQAGDKPADQPEAASVVVARINATLAKLPKEAGPQDFEKLKPLMMNVIQTAQQMKSPKSQVDPSGIHNVLEAIVKSEPVYGVVLSAIPGKALGIESELAQLVPSGLLETERSLTFRNAQTLNQIFYSVHPEYK